MAAAMTSELKQVSALIEDLRRHRKSFPKPAVEPSAGRLPSAPSESTVAKLIQRFRTGPPTSPSERERHRPELWWQTSSSGNGTIPQFERDREDDGLQAVATGEAALLSTADFLAPARLDDATVAAPQRRITPGARPAPLDHPAASTDSGETGVPPVPGLDPPSQPRLPHAEAPAVFSPEQHTAAGEGERKETSASQAQSQSLPVAVLVRPALVTPQPRAASRDLTAAVAAAMTDPSSQVGSSETLLPNRDRQPVAPELPAAVPLQSPALALPLPLAVAPDAKGRAPTLEAPPAPAPVAVAGSGSDSGLRQRDPVPSANQLQLQLQPSLVGPPGEGAPAPAPAPAAGLAAPPSRPADKVTSPGGSTVPREAGQQASQAPAVVEVEVEVEEPRQTGVRKEKEPDTPTVTVTVAAAPAPAPGVAVETAPLALPQAPARPKASVTFADTAQVCDMCNELPAAVWCSDCGLQLCDSSTPAGSTASSSSGLARERCNRLMHRIPKNAHHTRGPLHLRYGPAAGGTAGDTQTRPGPPPAGAAAAGAGADGTAAAAVRDVGGERPSSRSRTSSLSPALRRPSTSEQPVAKTLSAASPRRRAGKCQMCGLAEASLYCRDCRMYYCNGEGNDCSRDAHSSEETQRHVREPLGVLVPSSSAHARPHAPTLSHSGGLGLDLGLDDEETKVPRTGTGTGTASPVPTAVAPPDLEREASPDTSQELDSVSNSRILGLLRPDTAASTATAAAAAAPSAGAGAGSGGGQAQDPQRRGRARWQLPQGQGQGQGQGQALSLADSDSEGDVDSHSESARERLRLVAPAPWRSPSPATHSQPQDPLPALPHQHQQSQPQPLPGPGAGVGPSLALPTSRPGSRGQSPRPSTEHKHGDVEQPKAESGKTVRFAVLAEGTHLQVDEAAKAQLQLQAIAQAQAQAAQGQGQGESDSAPGPSPVGGRGSAAERLWHRSRRAASDSQLLDPKRTKRSENKEVKFLLERGEQKLVVSGPDDEDISEKLPLPAAALAVDIGTPVPAPGASTDAGAVPRTTGGPRTAVEPAAGVAAGAPGEPLPGPLPLPAAPTAVPAPAARAVPVHLAGTATPAPPQTGLPAQPPAAAAAPDWRRLEQLLVSLAEELRAPLPGPDPALPTQAALDPRQPRPSLGLTPAAASALARPPQLWFPRRLIQPQPNASAVLEPAVPVGSLQHELQLLAVEMASQTVAPDPVGARMMQLQQLLQDSALLRQQRV